MATEECDHEKGICWYWEMKPVTWPPAMERSPWPEIIGLLRSIDQRLEHIGTVLMREKQAASGWHCKECGAYGAPGSLHICQGRP